MNTSNDGRRCRVLVVDDEPEIVEILQEIVEGEGHAVEVAANGQAALACLSANSYDLVLSDLIMPDLDGPGLWRAVQRERPTLADRFVFITGDTLGEAAQRFLAAVHLPVIEKPFVPDEVRRALRSVLRPAR